MDEFKKTVARNIVTLRLACGMTQFELGEKLHYSDKSVSKWERGDALPDAYVLKQTAELFGVTVDYLLSPHEDSEPLPVAPRYSKKVITSIAFFGVWALSLLVFVMLWLTLGKAVWQIFAATLPVSLLVVMILHLIWGNRIGNILLISGFTWSLLAACYLCLLPLGNLWPIFLLGVPAQVLILLSFCVKRRR